MNPHMLNDAPKTMGSGMELIVRLPANVHNFLIT